MKRSTEEKLKRTGGEEYHWVDGIFVESDALRIAEKISEYDPNLRVQYLEYAASLGDPPFRIVELCSDGIERTVLYAWKLDDTVVERIYRADTLKNSVLESIEGKNLIVRKDMKRRYEEKMLEVQNQVESIIASPKDTYKAKDIETGEVHTFTSFPREPEKKIVSVPNLEL